jgi:hypothetical protein
MRPVAAFTRGRRMHLNPLPEALQHYTIADVMSNTTDRTRRALPRALRFTVGVPDGNGRELDPGRGRLRLPASRLTGSRPAHPIGSRISCVHPLAAGADATRPT